VRDPLTSRQRLAVAMLVSAGSVGVSTDELQEALWGHEGGDDTGAVRTWITRLRAVLPSGAHIRSPEKRRYVLEVDDGLVDASVFDDRAARRNELTTDELEQALRLWRSPTAFEGTEWPTIQVERRRLTILRRGLVLALAQRIDSTGELPGPGILAVLLDQFDTDTTDESAAMWTSRALAATGRRVEALRVLERNRLALIQVGLDQGATTRQFGEELLRNPSTTVRSVSSVAQPIRGIRTIRRHLIESSAISGLGLGPVAVVGVAGAGKTVLCDQLEATLRTSTGGVFRVVAPPDPTLVMQPIVELLGALEQSFPKWAEVVQADRLRGSVWSRAVGRPNTLVLERHAFLDHLADLVVDGLSQTSSCLMVDDHHHLDPNSSDLVARLARHPKVGDAFQLLCSSRHDLGGTERVAEGVTEGVTGGWQTIRLDPFSTREVAAALQPLLDENAIDSTQIAAIARWTGGSPLFLTLVADHIRDEGSTDALPGSVQRAVLDRLSTYSAKTRSVLDFAAVQGKNCRLGVLRRLVGTIDESLAEAMTDGLITTEDQSLSFVHELVSEAIARFIPPGRVVALHDQICEAMIAEGERPVAAALHGLRSAEVDPLRALSLCLAAAEEESEVLSWPNVVAWADHGLSLMRIAEGQPVEDARNEDPMRALIGHLLFQRGRARRLMAAAGSEADLIGAAERLQHDTDSFVHAVVELCRHGASHRQHSFDEPRGQLLREAMSRVLEHDHLVALKGAAPSVFMLRSDDLWGRSAYLQALDECGSATAPNVRRDVLSNALTGLQDPADLDRYDQALAGLAEFDDPSSWWESRVIEFTRALRTGNRESLDEAYFQLQALRSRVPRETARTFLRIEIAMLLVRDQQDEAWSHCQLMAGARVEGTTTGERAVFVAAAAPILLVGNRFSELRRHFESLRDDMPWANCWDVLLQLSDLYDGVRLTQPVQVPVGNIRRDLTWMSAMTACAQQAFVLQDHVLAVSVQDALRPHLNELVWTGVGVMHPVADAYALCCRVVGDDEGATQLALLADELRVRFGAPHLRIRLP
jgi:DNA-binding SARP family transcriptional activator